MQQRLAEAEEETAVAKACVKEEESRFGHGGWSLGAGRESGDRAENKAQVGRRGGGTGNDGDSPIGKLRQRFFGGGGGERARGDSGSTTILSPSAPGSDLSSSSVRPVAVARKHDILREQRAGSIAAGAMSPRREGAPLFLPSGSSAAAAAADKNSNHALSALPSSIMNDNAATAAAVGSSRHFPNQDTNKDIQYQRPAAVGSDRGGRHTKLAAGLAAETGGREGGRVVVASSAATATTATPGRCSVRPFMSFSGPSSRQLDGNEGKKPDTPRVGSLPLHRPSNAPLESGRLHINSRSDEQRRPHQQGGLQVTSQRPETPTTGRPVRPAWREGGSRTLLSAGGAGERMAIQQRGRPQTPQVGQMLSPLAQQQQEEQRRSQKVFFALVGVDTLTLKYGVHGLPRVALYSKGRE